MGNIDSREDYLLKKDQLPETLLKDKNATSDKIKGQGFAFKFDKVADALADLRGK